MLEPTIPSKTDLAKASDTATTSPSPLSVSEMVTDFEPLFDPEPAAAIDATDTTMITIMTTRNLFIMSSDDDNGEPTLLVLESPATMRG